MAQYKVNTDVLMQQLSSFSNMQSTLNQITLKLAAMNVGSIIQIKASTALIGNVTATAASISDNSKSIGGLSGALNEIASQYISVEQNLSEPKQSGKSGKKSGHDVSDQPDAEDSKPLLGWKDFWKVVGAAGTGGGVIGAVGQFITGGFTFEDFTKGTIKSVEKIADYVSKESSWDWSKMFGIYTKTDQSTDFLTNLYDQCDKLNPGKATNTAGKIATYAKWAGYIATVVFTTHDNFTDPENTTFGRRLAESIGESAVKIGEGLLIGAAVASIGATVGAPVIVVSGVTVLASWAVDAVCEHFTGKDFAETVSDAVIDGAQNVGKAIVNAGKKISGWWNKITDARWNGGGGGSW